MHLLNLCLSRYTGIPVQLEICHFLSLGVVIPTGCSNLQFSQSVLRTNILEMTYTSTAEAIGVGIM